MGGKMPSQNGNQGSRWVLWAVGFLGLCIFAFAFLQPAVRAGEGTSVIVFPGWKCASIALTETVALFGKSSSGPPSFEVVLVAMSGWINPLVLLLFLSSFWRVLLLLRRILAVLVLVCMAATWTFFHMQKVTPLVGHFLWIVGALLVLLPTVIDGWSKSGGRDVDA
jgi:hypothetical protein